MHRIKWAILALYAISAARAADSPAPPTIDTVRLESYIRYAEAFTPAVKMAIGTPGKTASAQLWAVPVHITLGEQTLDRTYYLTADGQEIVGGTVWYLGESPFAANLRKLPLDGPSFGPANAKINLVVFSDFQCPYCRQLASTIRQNIPKFYPNDVRVIFADFPLLTIHPWAHAMAEAARCVSDGDSQRFWTLHDWIFEHQGEINKDNIRDKIVAYAKDNKLDTAKIGACIDSHATAAGVDRDQRIGKSLQIDQTPVIFVNGRMLGGAQKWDTLDAVIKLDLQREKDLSGIPPGKSQ